MLEIQRYNRYWAIYDNRDLVCVTVYRKGAEEVVKRLKMVEKVSNVLKSDKYKESMLVTDAE